MNRVRGLRFPSSLVPASSPSSLIPASRRRIRVLRVENYGANFGLQAAEIGHAHGEEVLRVAELRRVHDEAPAGVLTVRQIRILLGNVGTGVIQLREAFEI